MRITIPAFAGELPRTASHHLPETGAVLASNCELGSGELRPLHGIRAEAITSDTPVRSIVKYRDAWLVWPAPVRVCAGPFADDAQERMYLTGAHGPQMFCKDDVQPRVPVREPVDAGLATVTPVTLGVPAPAVKLTATLEGAAVDPQSGTTIESVTYCYTLVTTLGEEGPPSPPSDNIDVDASTERQQVTLTGFTLPDTTGYRAIEHIRVYRSAVASSGVAKFQFLAELPVSTTTHTDNKSAADLGEVLPSQYWTKPVADLQDLTSLPGGVYAGFSGRSVYISEPLYPHAWPVGHSHTLEHDIIALAATGRTLVVFTQANVYTLYVEDPGATVPQRLDGYLPCVSACGVVETPEGVLFPSLDGLYLVAGGTTRAISVTDRAFDEPSWRALYPESFTACWHAGEYIAFATSTEGDRTTVIIEPGSSVATMRRGAFAGTALYVEPEGRTLYLAMPDDDGNTVIGEYNGSDKAMRAEWRSKEYRGQRQATLTCAVVDAEYPPTFSELEWNKRLAVLVADNPLLLAGAGNGEVGQAGSGEVLFGGDRFSPLLLSYIEPEVVQFILLADGKEVFRRNVVSGRPFALPGGYRATRWQVAVSSDVPIKRVTMATSMPELLQG